MKYYALNTINSKTTLNGAENLPTLCHYSSLLSEASRVAIPSPHKPEKD